MRSMAAASVPAMRAAGRGAIVNVASIHAVATLEGFFPYGAAKAGLVGLTRNMALDYGPWGIRANAVCPGFIDSPWFDKHGTPGTVDFLRQHMASNNPLKAYSTPEDVAGSALFLASPAARHVTGETLLVDAGMHLNG